MSSETHPPVAPDWVRLEIEAGQVFVPSAPIDKRQLFAGRLDQLSNLVDAIITPGQHAAVYGERGVGKTSLVSIVAHLDAVASSRMTVRQNCHSDDSFASLWRRAFEEVRFGVQRSTIGFSKRTVDGVMSLADQVPECPSAYDIVAVLRKLDDSIVFVFDEFDQLQRSQVAQGFAETIKALSDHNAPSKIVLVGVGDNVDQLISSHASIERALVQIRMPRMKPAELAEIISVGSKVLGMSWPSAAVDRVVRLAQGLPHYVHRLALFATRDALRKHSLGVTNENVKVGMKAAVDSASQSLTDAYLKATSSQRKDSLFGLVLLACALTKSDELGYFRPAWIKRLLKEMGHDLDVPAFASHLNKFSTVERGEILQKTGAERQWRYRFRNPLMQPYVIMRGIDDQSVAGATVDKVLADE